MDSDFKYRLVTRSDFDGLVSAVLLKELDMIDEIKFVHPKDMQDGLIDVTEGDITTNLPFVDGVHLAFDHHSSESLRTSSTHDEFINDPFAPSAARVVYEYYGGDDKFPNISQDMMKAVDQADSADFTIEEVLNPTDWVLLSFITDSRTGLGRFHDFRISNYDLMMKLIDLLKDKSIDEIMANEDVKERTELYLEQHRLAIEQIKRQAKTHENLVVLDLREEETIFAVNRFMIYALNPECNISMHMMKGKDDDTTVFAVGKSIFNKSSNTNVGNLMLKYRGGGHEAAGTCQVPKYKAEETAKELIEQMVADG